MFETHVTGSSSHTEYWIPAEELSAFNRSIEGLIAIEAAFFGDDFSGCVPDKFALNGKDVETQFVVMAKTWDYSRMDFGLEVSTNRKAVYLNFLFWRDHNFGHLGINHEQRKVVLEALKEAWQFNRIPVPLPTM